MPNSEDKYCLQIKSGSKSCASIKISSHFLLSFLSHPADGAAHQFLKHLFAVIIDNKKKDSDEHVCFMTA